ncbi:MAG: single-stranded DNA-binding protein [Myxococcota bacterium]
MSVNKIVIVGNLGADPEFKQTKSGQPMVKMSVATNRRWKNRDGEKQEETEWHKVLAFGPLAEQCNSVLGTGSQVYVEGRVQSSKFKDEDGRERKSFSIIAQKVEFLSVRGGDRSRRAA